MGVSTDGTFTFNKDGLDLELLRDKVSKNEKLKDSFIIDLIDIENSHINSFSNENFYLEEQNMFFDLIQECITNDYSQVTVKVTCLDADSNEVYTIKKDKIIRVAMKI